jgi:hypothetical protein
MMSTLRIIRAVKRLKEMRRRRNLKRRLNCPLSLMNIIPINDSSSQYAFH